MSQFLCIQCYPCYQHLKVVRDTMYPIAALCNGKASPFIVKKSLIHICI